MIDAGRIPGTGGAYALLIHLPRALVADIPALAVPRLAAGAYVYCGSAYGPGGLAARIGRHLRVGKRPRWHIDRLTEAGRVYGLALRVGARECDLVAALLARGATVPAPGFGSSDCRRCAAHLLSVPDSVDQSGLDDIVGLGRGRTAPL